MTTNPRALKPLPAPAAEPLQIRARPRRNRGAEWVRGLVRENEVTVRDLVWPVFVTEGKNLREAIPSMPGVERFSLDVLAKEIESAAATGISAVAIFPAVAAEKKTPRGEEALNPGNLANRAIRAVKDAAPHVGVFCDVALDPYTSHGHDGVLDEGGYVANDATVEILCKQALEQAAAGADFVAPSDMMDGRVGAIRDALDAAGFTRTGILSYAAKYASAFYGPFRDAVNSGAFLKGDKKTYQMDPANAREALREAAADAAEGADMLMVKPGLPYLDIVARLSEAFDLPVLSYHVSGEYAMLRAAAANGWLDYEKALMETLLAFRRAGSAAVLTYAARDAARLLKK